MQPAEPNDPTGVVDEPIEAVPPSESEPEFAVQPAVESENIAQSGTVTFGDPCKLMAFGRSFVPELGLLPSPKMHPPEALVLEPPRTAVALTELGWEFDNQ